MADFSGHASTAKVHPSARATLIEQLSQKRACPLDISAKPLRGAKHRPTLQQSSGAAASVTAADSDAVDVVTV